jgi:uncharacterized protein
MKTSSFLVFLSTVLIVYGLVNYYVYIRAYQGLEAVPQIRRWFTAVFLFISISYVAGRFLERAWISVISDMLTAIGSFWLAAMVYFLLMVLLIDLLRLINTIIPFFPAFVTENLFQAKFITLVSCVIIVSSFLFAGYLNARVPKLKELTLQIHKSAPERKSLKIAMASDIHMGTMVGRSKMSRIVSMLNHSNPDIIILCGDIVDEDLGAVIRENLGDELRNLSSPLGVYAITGNHEYIGGAEKAVQYYRDHGIKVLRDSAVLVDQCFYLVGREDKDKGRFSGKPRKELHELMKDVDHSKPIILLDHQPFHLERPVKEGVDLQLSGHTHDGQLWPFNYITDAIYEVSHGYLKKEETHFYVSSGAGTWGPPVRLGNRPEVLVVNLVFE